MITDLNIAETINVPFLVFLEITKHKLQFVLNLSVKRRKRIIAIRELKDYTNKSTNISLISSAF